MVNKRLRFFALMFCLVFMFSLSVPEKAEAGIWDSVTGAVGKAVNTVKDKVSDAADTVKEIATNAYETAKAGIKDFISSVTGIGKEAEKTVTGVATEVKKSAEKVTSDVNEAASKMATTVNDNVEEAVKAVDNVKKYVAGDATNINEYKELLEKSDVISSQKETKDEDMLASHPVLARLKAAAESTKEELKKKAADFSSLFKETVTGLDVAKDTIGPEINKGKNSIQLASALVNLKSSDNDQSIKAESSLASLKWTTTKDIQGHAQGDISVHEQLLKVDASVGPRFNAEYNGKFFDDSVKVTASTDNTLGAWANATGNVKMMKDGAVIDAKGEAKVGVGFKSENKGEVVTDIAGGVGTKTSGKLDVMAGAEASAKGTAYAGKNGIELSGKLGARCGAWVDGSVNHAVQYKGNDLFGVGAGGGVGAGLGAGVEGGFSFKANKIGIQDVGFTLGPVKVKATFYVNPVGIAEAAIDKGKEVVEKSKELAEKGKNLLNKAGDSIAGIFK